eukprot:scaffold386383_cov16-Prasinocladus_malaysianus.AAC.1
MSSSTPIDPAASAARDKRRVAANPNLALRSFRCADCGREAKFLAGAQNLRTNAGRQRRAKTQNNT